MSTKTKPKTAAKPKTDELPEWALKTPDFRYDLEMYEEGQGVVEGISLTRDEYVGLKQSLAKMRGIKFTAKEAAHA